MSWKDDKERHKIASYGNKSTKRFISSPLSVKGFYQVTPPGREYHQQIKEVIPDIEGRLYSTNSLHGFKYSGNKPYGMWTKRVGNKIIRIKVSKPPEFANASNSKYLVQFYRGLDDDTMKEYYSYSVLSDNLDDTMYKVVALMDYGLKTLTK